MKSALVAFRYTVTSILALLLVLLLFALESCTVGPKYVKPSTPTPAVFKEPPPAPSPGAEQWQPANPADQASRGKWWEIFGDQKLNQLEEQVAASNQDLKVYEARFREARAAIRFNRASQFPTISTAPTIAYTKSTDYSPSFPSKINETSTGEYVLPFDLSYELDLWGRVRRTVAAAREEAQATSGDYEGAKLSIEAELAMDYFELRSADAQKQLLDDTVKAYSDDVQLTTHRFKGGAAPRSDVAQAQTQLDTTRVQDTDVTVQRAQFEHAIAILIGKPPADFSLAETPLDTHPPTIPPGLPSELLQRRPDIAAAERRMAEANQQIGIAKAAYFPTVSLEGTAGFAGTQGANWFTWPAGFWALGPVLAQTLFDAGRRRATSESARANYDATVATYRQASLTAFQEVEDNLAALRILQNEAQQQDQAVASAKDSLHLFTNRYKGGVDTYLQVITAQTIELANERNAIDILRRRMDASVLLVKALGGGWDASQLTTFGARRVNDY
ncbi:MAG TPA: efflux transporter outer membrane subunit [Candidatus Acidoferrales bacterium]|jgi:NodT family efflux transporter outer membrane factor (OMF) lipoprotein|nr:efflux transporter outer membrane subunit [Candidatus Acidoferrales bacterium]